MQTFRCLAILLLISLSEPVLSAPAQFKLQTYTQPDKSEIQLRLRGDERFHWLETEGGYTVLHRKDGAYVFASGVVDEKLVPSDVLVGKSDPKDSGFQRRILPEFRRPQQGLPFDLEIDAKNENKVDFCQGGQPPEQVGNFCNLVVMARFSDHATRKLPTRNEIDLICNKKGGDPKVAPTGSLRDVFDENSYGASIPSSTVADWVTLPHTEFYYSEGVYGRGPKDHLNHGIESALQLIDQKIDFSKHDSNGNGYVDCVTFLHSGYGAEAAGDDAFGTKDKDRIWSRYARLNPPWVSSDGTKVCRVAVCAGLAGNQDNNPVRIGLLAHEIGHVLRLQDLYDNTQNDDGSIGHGIGSWGMMGNCWGFDGTGMYPPHFCAYSKIQFGWIVPKEIPKSGDFNIRAVEIYPDVFKFDEGFPQGEYLLIANRQPLGFDQLIPGDKDGKGGLAIWHIDENQSKGLNRAGFPGQPNWPQNKKHYKVALLQADGQYGLEQGMDKGNSTDLYRGSHTSTIGPSTVPSTSSYQGGVLTITPNVVSQISNSGNTMSFHFSKMK